MINSFPQELFQEKCQKIVLETLDSSYVNLFIKDFALFEDGDKKESRVQCRLFFSNDWKDLEIEGAGAGVVDALFNSMLDVFCKDFSSLRRLEFEDFSMEVRFKSFKVRPTDAPVEIKIALVNQRGKRIYFSAQSRSMTVALITAITNSFEYFINAEIAFKQLLADIACAKERNRTDLIDKYTNQASDLVSIVSYEGIF